ncbi:MAG: sigma-70 family RNA polymerase sigma factor [Anaerohalosphaera sp.]|nr:sigma-70 family RNA polymerase sigma factor [Anaerohalosphaera sp.]
MAASESMLLRRFAENGDSEAFSEIVKCYADPVYNTCRRILFDDSAAADAAQETFFQLMRNANSVKGSLSAWLHSVATHKAIDAIRRNSSRRSRERRYAFSKPKEVNQWKDISPYIDKELEKLPDEHREVLIKYFFESKTMSEIAELNRTSQPTVSRMVTVAVEELGKRLRKKGIIVAVIVLEGLVGQSTLQAAPAVLLTEVGKMSLVGATTGILTSTATASSAAVVASASTGSISALTAGGAKTAVTAMFSTVKAKVATAIAITAIGTGTVITYNHAFHSAPDITSTSSTETTFNAEPSTVDTGQITARSNQPIALGSQIMGGAMGGMAVMGPTDSSKIKISLTDPETTVDTFTEILISDNLDQFVNCFTPDSKLPETLNGILTDPQNTAEKQLQNAFNSIGKPVETLELIEKGNGLAMKIMYTVYDPFTIDNNDKKRTWRAGDQFEINAELVNFDKEWKIANLYTTKALPNSVTDSL